MEKKGYTALRKNHIERNAPKWCPKRNDKQDKRDILSLEVL